MIKRINLIGFVGLFLILGVIPISSESHPIDVLICTYDMGDKKNLLPLIFKLKKKVPGQQQGIRYKILAFGASKSSLKTHPALLDFKTQKGTHYFKPTETLSSQELIQLDQKVAPKIVVSGMSSKIQAQLLNHFKSKGAQTVAFYNGMDALDFKSRTETFFQEISLIDAYMVPHKDLIESLQKKLNAKHQTAEIIVTGQPALEEWDKAFAKTDTETLRTRLKLDPKKKTILFLGESHKSYKDEYPTYLKIFFESIRPLSNTQVLIVLYPKGGGNLERTEAEGLPHVRVVELKGISLYQLASIADLIVTYKAPIGVQALYKGIPVIYVAEPSYQNFMIHKGFAPQISEATALRAAIEGSLSSSSHTIENMAEKIGLPRNGTDIMADYVQRKIFEDSRKGS